MRPGSPRNSNFNTQYILYLYQSTHNTNMRPGSHRNRKFNTHYIWNLYQSTHKTNMRPGSHRNRKFKTQYILYLYQSTHNTNMRHNMRPGSHRNSKVNTQYIWNLYQSTHNTNMRHNMRPGSHRNTKFNTQYISDHHIINKSTFRQPKNIIYYTSTSSLSLSLSGVSWSDEVGWYVAQARHIKGHVRREWLGRCDSGRSGQRCRRLRGHRSRGAGTCDHTCIKCLLYDWRGRGRSWWRQRSVLFPLYVYLQT